MLCKEITLVNYNVGQVEAVTYRCKSWDCEICQPDRKAQLIMQAKAGKAVRFVTLTSHKGMKCSPEEARQRLSQAWAKMVKRLRRKFPNNRIEYLAVTERTKAGWPHLHILTRGPFIRQKWLSKCMADYIGAPIVDVRRIDSEKKAANYISKYVGKAPQRVGTSKRYYKSQNWLIDWQQNDKITRPPSAVWELVASSLERFKALTLIAAYSVEEESKYYLRCRASP